MRSLMSLIRALLVHRCSPMTLAYDEVIRRCISGLDGLTEDAQLKAIAERKARTRLHQLKDLRAAAQKERMSQNKLLSDEGLRFLAAMAAHAF